MYITNNYFANSGKYDYSSGQSFKSTDISVAMELKEKLLNNTVTAKELNKIYESFSEKSKSRIMEIVDNFKNYGIDRDFYVKKLAFQPLLLNCNSDKTVEKIKAILFVERNKTGKSAEELIPQIIKSKNLAVSSDKVYGNLLVTSLFKKKARPAEFCDKCDFINALKRYYKKNPDTKFDEIVIVKDEMSDDFINFTKKLSMEMSGRDDLFKVRVEDRVNPIKAPSDLKTDKEPVIRDILSIIKYSFVDNHDNIETLKYYKKLPERYHSSLSGFVKLMQQNKMVMNMYDVLPLFLKNSFLFNMEPNKILNLLKVKRFININTDNKNIKLREIIKDDFLPSGDVNTYYSHLLLSKMFPEGTTKPWYLRAPRSKNIGGEISTYLRENPDYRLTFDVIDDGEISDYFYEYVTTLSNTALKKNVFTVNFV